MEGALDRLLGKWVMSSVLPSKISAVSQNYLLKLVAMAESILENHSSSDGNRAIEKLKKKALVVIRRKKTIGNNSLIAKLKCSPDLYWNIRDQLIAEGRIAKGRGRGGLVKWIGHSSTATKMVRKKSKKRNFREKKLYSHVLNYITDVWLSSKHFQPHEHKTALTAKQGPKKTGGQWTRPDITAITLKKYQYIPGKILEVITFEIKPSVWDGTTGVYETSAHLAFAHKSFLMIHIENNKDQNDNAFKRIENECKRLGVGLITFSDPSDPNSYETLIEAEQNIPNPQNVDRFINDQIKPDTKAWIHSNI